MEGVHQLDIGPHHGVRLRTKGAGRIGEAHYNVDNNQGWVRAMPPILSNACRYDIAGLAKGVPITVS